MTHAIVLSLCALALLGVMPFVFFRRGGVTAGWLMTALPFFLISAVLLAALAGALRPFPLPPPLAVALSYAAIPLTASAIALIALTIGIHRAPVSMWHQSDDQPHVLVTTGPYAYVRHPFYAAFILLLLGCVAAFPHALTVSLAVLGVSQLNRTAAREERRLLASDLSREYADYKKRTRRFVPLRGSAGPAADQDVRYRARGRSRPARPASIPRVS